MIKIFSNFKIMLVLGVVIFAALIAILIWQSSKGRETIITTPVTTPVAFSPTPVQSFRVVSTKPAQDLSKIFIPIQQIEIEFNLPIDPANLSYTVNPSTKTNIRFKEGSDKIMLLSPDLMWTKGLTTITILKGTGSADGIKLQEDYIYKINTDFPEIAPPDSEGL